ncbi:hypothetical protein ACHAPT_001268 [Fusarium lateritium]
MNSSPAEPSRQEASLASVQSPSPQRKGPVKMSLSFETFPQRDVTDEMLEDAATLFSENYGIWGSGSKLCRKRVKLNVKRLRDQCLPEDGDCWYTRALSDGQLVGHAFTSRWDWDGKRVCWVTQLVVHKNYRSNGIASILLRMAMAESDDVYGIMSSHPHACMAAASSFGGRQPSLQPDRQPADIVEESIANIDIGFIRAHANAMMKASPVTYVENAVATGALFRTEDSAGLISGVDTTFFVDHEEPLRALEHFRRFSHWPLGDLPEGHEYLLILAAKQRR